VIVDGPISSSGYVWWKVNFKYAPDGWVAGNYIKETGQGPTTIFSIGDTVKTTDRLNTRGYPGTSREIWGTQRANATGKIIDGPVVADGFTWWQIDFQYAPDGWSVENYLSK